jgi:hypothetical protein
MLQQAIVRISVRIWSLRDELVEMSSGMVRDILHSYRVVSSINSDGVLVPESFERYSMVASQFAVANSVR